MRRHGDHAQLLETGRKLSISEHALSGDQAAKAMIEMGVWPAFTMLVPGFRRRDNPYVDGYGVYLRASAIQPAAPCTIWGFTT
jgi:hypothetical protein